MAIADLDNVLYGNMFDHMLGWWHQRHLPNLLFLKFEDMVREPHREIKRIARFCGKDDLPDAVVEKIVEATKFANMKTNPKTNFMWSGYLDSTISRFFRKGKIGDWKNHFNVAQNEMFERIIKDKFGGSGLEFCYESDGEKN